MVVDYETLSIDILFSRGLAGSTSPITTIKQERLVNLCEDQLHQLLQRLFSRHPRIDRVVNVPDIRLEGTRRGAQVTQKIRDHVGQARFSVKVLTVEKKAVVLHTRENKPTRYKNKTNKT